MPTKAFPSAYGFGTGSIGVTENIGGRGGVVYFVDHILDAGDVGYTAAGSLRTAFEASGPRIIIPRSGGTVELNSLLQLTTPFMTFAGQAAPGGGLLFKDWHVVINTHDVILRHLRSFTGLDAISIPPGRQTNPILIFGGNDKYHITLDHCSAAFSTDECLTIYGDKRWDDITVQWTLIADPEVSGHPDDGGIPHPFGTLLGTAQTPDAATRPHTVSLHHCIYVDCNSRQPLVGLHHTSPGWVPPTMILDMRNCLIYNWFNNNYTEFSRFFSTEALWDTWRGIFGDMGTLSQINVVKNHWIKGSSGHPTDPASFWVGLNTRVHVANNIGVATTEYNLNSSQDWTVAVASDVVTVDTIANHNFTAAHRLYTNNQWTSNILMRRLANVTITIVDPHTFTFSLLAPDQAAQTETNASAKADGKTVAADFAAMKPHHATQRWNGDPAATIPGHGFYNDADFESVEHTVPAIPETDVEALFDLLTRNCGAIFPVKDTLWTRIMDDILDDVGFIGSHSDYPTLAAGTYPASNPFDGISDVWKLEHGLIPATDYTGAPALSGYDHIENFLNELAGDQIPLGDYPEGPTNQIPANMNLTVNVQGPLTPISVTGIDVHRVLFGFDQPEFTLSAPDAGGASLKGG